MLISDQYKFIFIHIYKNAGISITHALLPFATTHRQTEIDNILRKFGLSYLYPVVVKNNSGWKVRMSNNLNNVFERLTFLKRHPHPARNHASASEIISKIGKEKFDACFSFGIVRNPWDWQVSMYNYGIESASNRNGKFLKRFKSFDNYIRWRCQEDVHYQKDFLFSESGEQLVDFIGKYENLEEDFQKICENIGIAAKLPRLNQSRHKPFQEYYTPDTVDLVRKTFAKDIDLFGYDFKSESI